MLFQRLNSEQEALTNSLRQKIIAAITSSKTHAISMSQYMQMALYDANWGYYNNLLHKFGRNGDFVTAPQISDLFAGCLARQIHQLWNNNDCPHTILEFGAGNGQLMLDILPLLEEECQHYYILELSANLTKLQQQSLHEQLPHLVHKVIWLDKLPNDFSGIILANEVLDAQPCEVVVWQENANIKSRCVSVDSKGALCYLDTHVTSSELLARAKALNINSASGRYISEISLANYGFIKTLAQMLKKGCMLFIDYGYTAREYYAPDRINGTLRGFFQQHQIDDILSYPGLIDITASVDFSSIAVAALESDLTVAGYATQGNFLLNCGLLDIVENENLDTNSVAYYKRSRQVQQLTMPNEMGNIFKVMALSKNIKDLDYMGFSHNDLSHTL